MLKSKKKIRVAVSGYFDPIHVGHIKYLAEAKKLGTELIVILSRDGQCLKKKGYVFMPYLERKVILESIRYVNQVVPNLDGDTSCANSLREYHPDIFAKGGDRNPKNMPIEEIVVAKAKGIKIIYGVGGGKIQSSSWLIGKVKGLAKKKK